MKLSRKFRILLLLVVMVPFILVNFLVLSSTRSNLNKVGDEISKNDISRINTYINSLIDEHTSNYIAWTLWDELYNAVKSRDKLWLESNVLSMAKENSFYETFIVYDINGNIISECNSKDLGISNLKNLSIYKKINANTPCAGGIYKASDNLYIITVTKVVKVDDNEFKSPIGYVLYARKFNQLVLDKGKKILNMDIAVKFANNSVITTNKDIISSIKNIKDFKQNTLQTVTYTKNNVLFIGSSQLLYDSDNNVVGVLGVQSSSAVWTYLLKKSILVNAILVIVVLILSILVYIWFKYNVVSTIVRITGIIKSKDLRQLLSVKGKDEITELCNEFNKMLGEEREIINNFINSANLIGTTSNEISNTTNNLRSITLGQADMISNFVNEISQSNIRMQDITNNMSLLAKNVNDTSLSMAQMSNSIQETAKNLEEASGSVSEVSLSIEEMGISIKNIASRAKEVESEAQNTVVKAKEGTVAVGMTINEIDKISKSVTELASAIKKLGESAGKIDDIVNVIDDIAEQTNLLSLNAAIEAARAGDSGKGFAVVANSIRSLAEKSSEATKDIAKLIKGIQIEVESAVSITEDSTSRVKEGVEYAKSTGTLFEDIFNAISKTNVLVQEITCAIEEQETGSKDIMTEVEKMNNFITELSAIAEQQAAGSEEIVSAVDQMNILSQKVSSSTGEQAARSNEKVKLIQEISKGTLDVSNGSEEIALAIQNLAKQADELIRVVNQFKFK